MWLFNRDHVEKPVKNVPILITFIVSLALISQLLWHGFSDSHSQVSRQRLYNPPSDPIAKLLGIGDAILISKILMLWLQAFDNQPSMSIPFNELDYQLVIKWMERSLSLDPNAKYPLLLASRVYSQVPNKNKTKQMLAFVYQQFLKDPETRWPAMAHIVYVARHKLKDLHLALHYAHAMNTHIKRQDIPPWVRQMELYVLEDMSDIEAARTLINILLTSAAITDSKELQFLQNRLKTLEAEQ